MNHKNVFVFFTIELALGLIAWLWLGGSAPARAAPNTGAVTPPRLAARAPLAAPTATTFTVNTRFDGVFSSACANATAGHCTLREAILEANATSGATINLPGLLAGQFYYVSIAPSGSDDGTTGDLHINADMNIVGQRTLLHPSTVIDASLAGDRVFTVTNGLNVNISNVTIRYGSASNGGGIYNGSNLTLNNTTIFSNTATTVTFNDGGGGLYNANAGNLALNNSTIISNTATRASGAGIFNAGTLSITNNTVVTGNNARYGGGIFLNGGTMSLSNATVTGNSAVLDGGGINFDFISGGSASLSNVMINSNTSSYGGGIYLGYVSAGSVSFSSATISGNFAELGGGIFIEGGQPSISNVTVSGNSAAYGGGIAVDDLFGGSASIGNVTVSGNTVSFADSGGGGIFNNGSLSLSNVTISGNTVINQSNGGGILNSGALTVTNSSLISNTSGLGGGVYSTGGLTLTNSTISANTAGNQGGGIYNQGVARLIFGTLNGNKASSGGGIYENAMTFLTQTVTLLNTIVANSTGGNCAVQNIALKSNGYNLSSDGACATDLNQPGDQNGANPNLGPLTNNGGPTLTLMPQFPSPAINAIPNGTNGCGTTITTDQRGTARPIPANGKCDIGAVEYDGLFLLRLFLPLILR